MKIGALAKTRQQIEEYVERHNFQPPTADQIQKVFREKYPNPAPTLLPEIPENTPIKEQVDPIEVSEVLNEIRQLKIHKATGVHGLSAAHLKYLASAHPFFLNILADAFNSLMVNPNDFDKVRSLLEFRPVFIPKKE